MLRQKFLTILILGCLTISAFGQMIGKVTFQQQGTYLLPEDVFEMNTQTKAGMRYSERIVNDDVRRLFAKGIFTDVVSEVKNLENGTKEVIFHISPKPLVESVVFTGNKKVPEEKLRELIKIQSGSPLNDSLLVESTDELRKYYRSKGMTDAEILVRPEVVGENLKIEFLIQENARIRIDHVDFEYMTAYTPKEVRPELETRYFFPSVDWLSWFPMETLLGIPGTLGVLDREAIERDKIRLRELYWRKGYLDFEVTEVQISEIPGNPDMVAVTFVVDEGEPYQIGKVSITGTEQFTEEELLSYVFSETDAVYSSQVEEEDVHALEAQYSPLGFADFQVQVRRSPDFSTHKVDLEFQVREGTQYTVNEVYISGNKWTKQHVIRRELAIEQGDFLDKELLEISKSRLMGMGYFGSEDANSDGVDIVAVDSPVPGKKDVHIKVEEKRFIDGSIGAGWSDSDGLAGSIQITHNNMDILDPKNFFTGGGQRLRIGALIGIEQMDAETTFTEPYLFGIPLRFDISGYWRRIAYDDWMEQRLGLTTSLTKRIFDDFTTISGGYTFEQVRIMEMTGGMSKHFTDYKGSELLGRIFLSLDRDTRDNALNPTSGYTAGLYTSITSKALGGSRDYYKAELHGTYYYPFINDWFVMMVGAKIGTTGSIGSGDVPLYDRYFLGGGGSVRGFPYRSIGPTDGNRDNYGGQFMYLFTAELSHPIYSKMLRGAVFVDVGDATSGRFGPITSPNVGVGYGLRILVPGIPTPLRLDLAYPIVNHQDNVSNKLRFHFNIGFSI